MNPFSKLSFPQGRLRVAQDDSPGLAAIATSSPERDWFVHSNPTQDWIVLGYSQAPLRD